MQLLTRSLIHNARSILRSEIRVALDANRLTDLFRRDSALAVQLGACSEIWIPLTMLGEIKAGFYGGNAHRQNEILLNRMLAKPAVRILSPTRETAEQYARQFVQLKRAGTPIPDNDLWIAALTLEHALTLITRDKHFRYTPQLLLG